MLCQLGAYFQLQAYFTIDLFSFSFLAQMKEDSLQRKELAHIGETIDLLSQ
jgi:hypothetical protein